MIGKEALGVAVSSYSQVAEDLLAAYLLGTARELRYIDIGCLWPVEHSNTYLFYVNDGIGVCIDANPEIAAEFEATRPRDTFLNTAIGAVEGTRAYHRFENPVFNTFAADRAKRLKAQAEQRPGRALREKVEVPLVTLDTALAEVEVPTRDDGRVDLVSIDVEGLELEVLKGFSFEPRPRLIVCEQIRSGASSREHEELDALMSDHGYRQAAHTGHDVFYLANDA